MLFLAFPSLVLTYAVCDVSRFPDLYQIRPYSLLLLFHPALLSAFSSSLCCLHAAHFCFLLVPSVRPGRSIDDDEVVCCGSLILLDVGFGGGNTSVELCARWMQLGSLYPFSRNHHDPYSQPQEPYMYALRISFALRCILLPFCYFFFTPYVVLLLCFSPFDCLIVAFVCVFCFCVPYFSLGPIVLSASRHSLRLRYSLLPYFYSCFFTAHLFGSLVWSPLFLAFSEDTPTHAIETEFMIGEALLGAPVLDQGETTVDVYLPDDTWFVTRTCCRVFVCLVGWLRTWQREGEGNFAAVMIGEALLGAPAGSRRDHRRCLFTLWHLVRCLFVVVVFVISIPQINFSLLFSSLLFSSLLFSSLRFLTRGVNNV